MAPGEAGLNPGLPLQRSGAALERAGALGRCARVAAKVRLRAERGFGRLLVGMGVGVAGGCGLGLLLGAAVAWIYQGGRWWGLAEVIGAGDGAMAGSLCGLGMGLARAVGIPRWAGRLLGTLAAAAAGARFGAQYSGMLWIGSAAGAVGGLSLTALLERLLRRPAGGGLHAAVESPSLPGSGGEMAPGSRAALQGRIRRYGRLILCLRFLLPLALIPVVWQWFFTGSAWSLFSPAFVLGLAYLAALPVSLPLARLYRRSRLKSLRRQLAALPSEAREQLLAPLGDPGDPGTCEIAAPLLREARAATEVAPAGPPTCGGELVPAGSGQR